MNLYPYQEQGVYFLRSRKRALLYDDPGLGKTAQSLTALPPNPRTIIISPASVKGVWANEIARWRPDIVPTVLKGTNSFRAPERNESVILNPDILPDYPNIDKYPYNLIIDECHAFKSVSSLRSKRLKLLRNLILGAGGSVWGLTGTPILSRPEDLWGILSALGLAQDAFGNYDNFIRVFNGKRLEFRKWSKISWGKPTNEAATCLSKIGLGRKRETVLPDLPTKTYETYEVSVPAYSSISGLTEEEVYAKIEEPGWLSTERQRLATAKTEAVLPFLRELNENEPLVIFTTHKESAEKVAEAFSTTPITGDTATTTRNVLVEQFMAGNTNVIVGTVFAMGVGFTLTRANRVIFISRDWTPALNKQAEDRVCRIGQTRGVIVTDIVSADPTERIVYSVLMRKQRLIEASVEKSR